MCVNVYFTPSMILHVNIDIQTILLKRNEANF